MLSSGAPEINDARPDAAIRPDSSLPPSRQNHTLRPRNIISEPTSTGSGVDSLTLRPRYLCFVVDVETKTYNTIRVLDYLQDHGPQADTEFVFISYTRLQFRIATDAEIDAYAYPDEATREANRQVARKDRQMLISWAIDATLATGKRAFWLDFECVRDADGIARSSSNSKDVHHICDIVRAAHSMIIALSDPAVDKVARVLKGGEGRPSHPHSAIESTRRLRQWGSRLWTLPEVLLCPSEYRIKIYDDSDGSSSDGAKAEPKSLAKRNFAERAWDDAEVVKELMDHFEGSAILNSVHLLSTALECFARRKTDQFSRGDIAYAIRGLVADRQRPAVHDDDSGFRAFARLSLAIDDGSILARLICLWSGSSPSGGGGEPQWFDTSDRWGAKIKDIHPGCRAVEVTDHDALVLDGLVGATIHWDRIHGEASLDIIPDFTAWALSSCLSIGVLALKYMLQWVAAIESLLPELLLSQHRNFVATIIRVPILHGAICLIVPLLFLFSSSRFLQQAQSTPQPSRLSRTRIVSMAFGVFLRLLFPFMLILSVKIPRGPRKPRLIGIEGTASAAQIERHLWGLNCGKLTTVTLVDGEPTRATASGPQQAQYAFTIVDTQELVVTHFRCARPPVAMFVAGHEGSVHRALLCSYDWETDTFHREAVLRVGPRVHAMMRPVGRVQISRQMETSPVENSTSTTPQHGFELEAAAFEAERITLKAAGDSAASSLSGSAWKARLAFLYVILVKPPLL